jgi:uncharacterized protein (DUF983 family)
LRIKIQELRFIEINCCFWSFCDDRKTRKLKKLWLNNLGMGASMTTESSDKRIIPSQRAGGLATMVRGLRLRCPRCGRGPIFRGWFSMHPRCPACGRLYDRAPGYLLGSIYFNYGVTAMLVVIVYFSLYFSETLTGDQLLVALTAFGVLFPLWFFRYARGLWIAFDERWDPWPNEEEARRGEGLLKASPDGPETRRQE